MANRKVSASTELTTTPEDNDLLMVVDVSDATDGAGGTNKKLQFSKTRPEVLIEAATQKTTPIDSDSFGLVDSAASNALKKLTWANVKATLLTYFADIFVPYTYLS